MTRRSLDEVDSGIVGLIAQRSQVIAEIARLKEGGTSAIRDADRERQVLAGVEAEAADLGVSANLVRRIFRELIDDSVAQQARRLNGGPAGRLRVAFQGSAHSYSDAAARKYLAARGTDGDLAGFHTFSQAADALLAGEADLAVLPIENTTAGSINEVYSLLREHELFIVGEETWKVDHCLAAVQDVPLAPEPGAVSPSGPRAVRGIPAVAAARHPDELLRHGRGHGRGRRRGRSERRCHRLRRGRASPRPGGAQARGRRLRRQLHALRGAVDRRYSRRYADCLQDEPDLDHPARGGCAAALSGNPVEQRPLDDQAGVAASSGKALGVPVLP